MIELEINQKNLKIFLNDIREKDKEELIYHFKKDYKKTFIKITKNLKNTYFVADKDKNPVAIGGFQEYKGRDILLVWLLCTNKLKENKKELYKYIKTKVEAYKKKSFIMFNYIYKSNFSSLNFLKKLGFEIVDLANNDFKLFYFMKGNDFDIRYITD